MGFLDRLLGQRMTCGFCGASVRKSYRVALIKGTKEIANFEKKLGTKCGHTMHDTEDRELVVCACTQCVGRTIKRCNKCHAKVDVSELLPVTIEGRESGEQLSMMVCSECFANFLTDKEYTLDVRSK